MTTLSNRTRGILLVLLAIACGVSYGFAIKALFRVSDLLGPGLGVKDAPFTAVWTIYLTGLVLMTLGLLWPSNRLQTFSALKALRHHRRGHWLAFGMLAYTLSLMGYYLMMASGVRIGEVNFLLDLDSALVILISFVWLWIRGRRAGLNLRITLGVALATVGWYIVATKGSLTEAQVLLALGYVVGAALGDVLVQPSAREIDGRGLVVLRWLFILVALGLYALSQGELLQCLPGIWELLTWQVPGSAALYLVAAILVGLFVFRFFAFRYLDAWEVNAWMFSQMFLVFGVTLLVASERPAVDDPYTWGIGAVCVSVGLYLVSFGRHSEA